MGIILSVVSGIICFTLLYILREDLLNFGENNYDIFRCRLVFHPVTNDICQRLDGEFLPVIVEKISDEELERRKIITQFWTARQ